MYIYVNIEFTATAFAYKYSLLIFKKLKAITLGLYFNNLDFFYIIGYNYRIN